MDFQEEFSDMLLLKMLQAATRASADKARVRSVHTFTHMDLILSDSN